VALNCSQYGQYIAKKTVQCPGDVIGPAGGLPAKCVLDPARVLGDDELGRRILDAAPCAPSGANTDADGSKVNNYLREKVACGLLDVPPLYGETSRGALAAEGKDQRGLPFRQEEEEEEEAQV